MRASRLGVDFRRTSDKADRMRLRDHKAAHATAHRLSLQARTFGLDAVRRAVAALGPKEKAAALATAREAVSLRLLLMPEEDRTRAIEKLSARDRPVFLWHVHYHARRGLHVLAIHAVTEMRYLNGVPSLVSAIHAAKLVRDAQPSLWPEDWGEEPW
jgi:hypothetical protein